MSYDLKLADRIRNYLREKVSLPIEEKKMFSGLAFMVDGKMCVNVSGDKLMCRFDPALQKQLASRKGYLPMIMKNREYSGYCYISPEGFKSNKDLEYYVDLCLAYNTIAKSSKKSAAKK